MPLKEEPQALYRPEQGIPGSDPFSAVLSWSLSHRSEVVEGSVGAGLRQEVQQWESRLATPAAGLLWVTRESPALPSMAPVTLAPHSRALSLHFRYGKGACSSRQLPRPTTTCLIHTLLCPHFLCQVREGRILGPTCLPCVAGKKDQDGWEAP